MAIKISKKWRKVADLYRRFAADYPLADFTEDAAESMFAYESMGAPLPKTERLNGFMLGKKWMDVTVAQWREDIANKQLLPRELVADGYTPAFLARHGIDAQ